MSDNKDARIDELKAENAKLREQIQDAEHEESVAWDRVRSAERRNDKLRELVKDLLNAWDDMQREVVTGPTFDDCERRAYELGIEVDV